MATLRSIPALNPRRQEALLFGIVATEILVLCIPGLWWGYIALAVLSAAAVAGVILSVLRNRATGVVLGWALLFPLGYYCTSFPREQPVVTLDRAFIIVLLVAACLAGRRGVTEIGRDLRGTALWWAVFVFFAALTLPRIKLPMSGIRVLVEGFIFPAVLAWYVIRYIRIREHLESLHLLTCIMACYIAGVGAAEVVLQRDLMALPSSAVLLAGGDQQSDFLVRPNGPFSSTNSFALIGLVTFLFLLFLRKAIGDSMPGWQRMVHRVGVAGALLATILPLFRSVFTSLLVILIFDVFYQRGVRRVIRLGVIFSFLLVALLIRIALPSVFEERSDTANIYGRIAEQKQVLNMFLDNPLNGVGFTNFPEAASSSKYTAYYRGVQSVDNEHNNLSAILAETGLAGFLPYLVSQILLFGVFWRLRKNGASAALAWRYFLFVFLGYWVNGMSLTSGYYSDLNLWYMFVLAVLYKFAKTGPIRPEPALIAA